MAETLLVNVKVNAANAQKKIDSLVKAQTKHVNVKLHVNTAGLKALNSALRTPRQVNVNLRLNKKPLAAIEKQFKSFGKIKLAPAVDNKAWMAAAKESEKAIRATQKAQQKAAQKVAATQAQDILPGQKLGAKGEDAALREWRKTQKELQRPFDEQKARTAQRIGKLRDSETSAVRADLLRKEAQIRNEMNALRSLRMGKNKGSLATGDYAQIKSQIGELKSVMGELQTLRGRMPASGLLGDNNLAKGIDTANSKFKTVLATATSVRSELTGRASISNALSNEVIGFNKLGAKMSDYYTKFGHNLRKNQGLYEKFLSLQNKANTGGFRSIRDANQQWAQFQTAARAAGVQIDTFGSKLQRTFGSRIRSATAGMGVFMIQSAVRGIVNSAKEVDTAMTELKKVTFETNDVYEKFLDNAGGRAQKIGATLRDTVSATADFARLGYNIDEATKLADSALIYKNVGDDVDTIDDATKAIISTMQGFNIEAENSMQIVDKFDWVADNYASSAGDIGQITQRSAAAMAAAGNSLDETIALGVAANEVQQDADTVGTALKTMSMRLRGSKTDMESMGLDTEGMASSVSKLRDQLISLSGVDIMLDDETFKSSYDILIGMGEVWDNLSDINRANITELLFGKRQANIGSAIIQNYERAQDILETSQTSSGRALKENEVYLNSIQGHLDVMKSKWEEFSVAIAGSKELKSIIDVFGGIGKALTGMTNAFGTTAMVMTPLIAAMSKTSNFGIIKSFDKMDKAGNISQQTGWAVGPYGSAAKGQRAFNRAAFISTLKSDVASLKDYNKMIAGGKMTSSEAASKMAGASDAARKHAASLNGAKADVAAFAAEQGKMNKMLEGSTAAFSGISAATKAMAGNIAVMLALSAAIKLIGKGIEWADNKFKISSDAKLTSMKDAINEYTTATKEVKDNTKSINSVADEFKTLSQGVDENGHNVSLSADQFERYNEIVRELADISPGIVQRYNDEGNAIVNRNSAIEEAIALQEEYADTATRAYTKASTLTDIMNGVAVRNQTAYASMNDTVSEMGKELGTTETVSTHKMYTSRTGRHTRDKTTIDAINAALEREVDLESLTGDELREIADKRDLILTKMHDEYKASKGISESEQQKLDNAKKWLQSLAEQSETIDANSQETFKALQTYASSSDVDLFSKLPESMRDSFNAGLREISKTAANGPEAQDMAKELASGLSELSTNSDYREAIKGLEDAKEEFLESDRTKENAEAASAAMKDELDVLRQLSSDYSDNLPMKAAIDDLIKSYSDFPQQSVLDLATAFNPLLDRMKEARDAKTKFDEAMSGGDMDTAINAHKEIYDTIMDDYNNAGNGTMAFWTGAEQILGKSTLKDFGYDIDKVNAKLKEWAPAMDKNVEGTSAFFEKLAENREELNQIEGVDIAENGAFDIPEEKYDAVAHALGISSDALVSMVDNARHWADIKLWDSPERAVTAIKNLDTTFTDAEGKAYQFYDTVEQQARMAGLTGQELERYMKDIGKSVELIDTSKLDIADPLHKVADDKTVDKIAKQFTNIDPSIGKDGKMNIEGITALYKQMGRSVDETTRDLEKFAEAGDLEGFNKDNIDDISDYVTGAFAELNENDPFTGVTSSVDGLTAAINQLVAAMGEIPDDWLNGDQAIKDADAIKQKIAKGGYVQEDELTKRKQELIDKNEGLKKWMSSHKDEKGSAQYKEAEKAYADNHEAYQSIKTAEIEQGTRAFSNFANAVKDAKDADEEFSQSESAATAFDGVEEAAQKAGMSVEDYFAEFASGDQLDTLLAAYDGYKLKVQIDADVDQVDTELSSLNSLTDEQRKLVVKGVLEFEQTGDADTLTETINSLPPEVRTQVITTLQNSDVQMVSDYATGLESIPEDVSTNVEVTEPSGTTVDIGVNQEDPETEFEGEMDISVDQEEPETEFDGELDVYGEGAGFTEDPVTAWDGWLGLIGSGAGFGEDPRTHWGGGLGLKGSGAGFGRDPRTVWQGSLPTKGSGAGFGKNPTTKWGGGLRLSGSGAGFTKSPKTNYSGVLNLTVHKNGFSGTPNRRRALADGTPNRRRFGSAARGGRLGPRGKGGLTLTGELGPELVWLPDEDISYLTGTRGPEMQALPANAVVWPHDETKRIFGGTVPPGLLSNKYAWSRSKLNDYLNGDLDYDEFDKLWGSVSRGTNPVFGSMSTGTPPAVRAAQKEYNAAQKAYDKKPNKKNKKKRDKAKKKLDKAKEKANKSKKSSSKKSDKISWSEYTETQDYYKDMEYYNESEYYNALKKRYKKYKKDKKTDHSKKELRAAKKAIRDAYIAMLDAQAEKLEQDRDLGKISAETYYNKLKKLGSKYGAKYTKKEVKALKKTKAGAGGIKAGDRKYAKEYQEYLKKLQDARDAMYDAQVEKLEKQLDLGQKTVYRKKDTNAVKKAKAAYTKASQKLKNAKKALSKVDPVKRDEKRVAKAQKAYDKANAKVKKAEKAYKKKPTKANKKALNDAKKARKNAKNTLNKEKKQLKKDRNNKKKVTKAQEKLNKAQRAYQIVDPVKRDEKKVAKAQKAFDKANAAYKKKPSKKNKKAVDKAKKELQDAKDKLAADKKNKKKVTDAQAKLKKAQNAYKKDPVERDKKRVDKAQKAYDKAQKAAKKNPTKKNKQAAAKAKKELNAAKKQLNKDKKNKAAVTKAQKRLDALQKKAGKKPTKTQKKLIKEAKKDLAAAKKKYKAEQSASVKKAKAELAAAKKKYKSEQSAAVKKAKANLAAAKKKYKAEQAAAVKKAAAEKKSAQAAYKSALGVQTKNGKKVAYNAVDYYNSLKNISTKGLSAEKKQEHAIALKEARQEAYDYKQQQKERALNNSFTNNWKALRTYMTGSLTDLKGLNSIQDADKIIEERQNIVDNFFGNLQDKFEDVKQTISDHDLFGDWDQNQNALTLLIQYKNDLIKIYKEYESQLKTDTDAAKQYQELMKEVEREMVQAQKEIKSQYDDIFELVERLIRQEKQDLIQALNKQKDKYDEIIAKKKESLQITEDELNYQDQLADYAKQEAKLRTQIATLSRDDSREAKAKVAELTEQLNDLIDEKQRTIRSETITRTQDALDKQQEKYDEFIDGLTQSIQDGLDNQEVINQEVYDALNNRDTNDLLQRLYDYNAEHGDGLMQTVEEWQHDLNDILGNQIYGALKNNFEAIRAKLINETGYDGEHIGRFTTDATTQNSDAIREFLDASTELSDKYYDNAVLLDTLLQKYDKLVDDINKLYNGQVVGKHHSGLASGFVGMGANLKQHEMYSLLTDDELVLNRDDQMRIGTQLNALALMKQTLNGNRNTNMTTGLLGGGAGVALTVNAPVTIKGDVTPDVMKQLDLFGDSIADKTFEKLESTMRMRGLSTTAASNGFKH